MKRILLRAKKNPFQVVSPQETLERNLIGTNSGNLVFIEAAYKLLSTGGTRVEVQHRLPLPKEAETITERYDAYVVPLANAFRAPFESYLINLTRLIQRLRIPVVILGVGAQSGVDYHTDHLKPIERTVKAFVAAVLDRSPSIGVRGEFSQHYLNSLGFHDVEVIGCPSMFLYGSRMQVDKAIPSLDDNARIAINCTPDIDAMREILIAHHARYPNLAYVAQDLETLALLLWQERPRWTGRAGEVPLSLSHPIFTENKVRLFVDPWPWISYLKRFEFSFGTRIHGNIVALIAGVPAYVLAHDSRTLELARYFGIPYRLMRETGTGTDARDLYEEADYAELNRGHAARWGRFADFLRLHGLDHAYTDEQDAEVFDKRVAATSFPPAVDMTTIHAQPRSRTLLARLRFRARQSAPNWVRQLRRATARSPVHSPD